MTEKAKRRRFSKSYKLRIVEEADQRIQRGELGALLRRDGLYASILANCRRQEADGVLEPGPGRKPKASKDPALQAALAQRAELERDNRQLRRKLAHAEKIIAIQKSRDPLGGDPAGDEPGRDRLAEPKIQGRLIACALALPEAPSDICEALGLSRATLYRALAAANPRQSGEAEPADQGVSPVIRISPRALSPEETQQPLDILHSGRFVDLSPIEQDVDVMHSNVTGHADCI